LRRWLPLVVIPVVGMSSFSAVPVASAAPAAPALAQVAARHHNHTRGVCTKPHKHFAGCNAVQLLDAGGHPLITAAPQGLGPADLLGAYGLPAAGSALDAGAGRVVALVDAYDDPHAAADLAVYRAHYGLPPADLTIVAGSGSGPLPAPNSGWAEETSLDLDAVSAVCASCSIVLVEAATSSIRDLLIAERTAVHLPGVVSVSNSWGGSEPSNVTALDPVFTSPGVFVTASSGDDGYGVEFPAAAPDVVAVGGTSLTVLPGHLYGGETAWSGAGSGCSVFAAKTLWQTAGGVTSTACTHRAVADAAAVADPETGLSVYDSYGQRATGWFVVGGTSLASPIIAAVHALSGSTRSTAASLYAAGTAVHDITHGTNGTCRHKVLCTAGKGWDGPTGVGSPAGLAGW
jgi:subtilase family serine protease